MKKRDFLKTSAIIASSILFPRTLISQGKSFKKIRTAHIGVGGMGFHDLKAISSHNSVEVVGLCDVDSDALLKLKVSYPNVKTYKDYRIMLSELSDQIDAVIISTPDHTHAPAALMAMKNNKAVYCQKPLAHSVSELREMRKISEEKNLTTQMGIQVHSFYDYKLATLLIPVSYTHLTLPTNSRV